MNTILRIALTLTGWAMAAQAFAQVTFYEHDGYQGRSFSTQRAVADFEQFGFNDRASSVVVRGKRSDRWEVCEDGGFSGRCVVLRPGEYPSLSAMGLNDRVSSVRIVDRNARVEDDRYAPAVPPADASQIVLYEHEGFEGRSFSASTTVDDFRDNGFNDRASSIVVRGGRSDRWEVCEDGGFGGRCVVLRPGQYPSLTALGLNDRVSSARVVDRDASVEDDRYAPLPMVSRDYGRRNNERLYEADIIAVRAVVDTDGQRCWVDSAQAAKERDGRQVNVPGALIGAVIGGILGHQVGGGTGKNVATGIGVIAGAAVGSQVGGKRGRDEDRSARSHQLVTTQDVPRCPRSAGSARPAYWDVTYRFRGQEHRVQMTTPPGKTVTVNEQGEPRA
ncbi:MAG: beta/gamma crystallin-related protein [Pseudomonadota bacterium]|nr:beta/gamma crystallin-related protein [Pseudomonadota bacterium]